VLVVGACAWTVPILLGLVPSEAALTPLVALLVAVYSAGRHAPTRRAVIGAAVALAAALASDLRMPHPGVSDFGFTVILISWPCFAGFALRSHAQANAVLADRARLLEAERDAKAEAAVAAERASLARDLHDIIAHFVSLMVVQAGAAEQVLDRQPARAREALRAIGESGRAPWPTCGRVRAVAGDVVPVRSRDQHGGGRRGARPGGGAGARREGRDTVRDPGRQDRLRRPLPRENCQP
jgi:signal transduction histidine kinase